MNSVLLTYLAISWFLKESRSVLLDADSFEAGPGIRTQQIQQPVDNGWNGLVKGAPDKVDNEVLNDRHLISNVKPNINENIDKVEVRQKKYANITSRLINRDTDDFYDNEVVMKLRSEELNNPQEMLEVKNEDQSPMLVIKEPVKHHAPKKREVLYSDNDDYYYVDQANDPETAYPRKEVPVSNKITNIESKEVKNVPSETLSSNKNGYEKQMVTEQEGATAPAVADVDKTQVQENNEKEDISKIKPKKLNENVDLNHLLGEPVSKGGKMRKIVSKPKKKNSCITVPPSNCLPSGGFPKNPNVPLQRVLNDTDYDKVLSGEIAVKLVDQVLAAVAANTLMNKELGLCQVDLNAMKCLYASIRQKEKPCCYHVVDELKCFLNWMLELEVQRKKRDSILEPKSYDYEKPPERLYDSSASFPDFVGIRHVSPEYQKLYEKVQEYKEKNENPWDTDPTFV